MFILFVYSVTFFNFAMNSSYPASTTMIYSYCQNYSKDNDLQ